MISCYQIDCAYKKECTALHLLSNTFKSSSIKRGPVYCNFITKISELYEISTYVLSNWKLEFLKKLAMYLDLDAFSMLNRIL